MVMRKWLLIGAFAAALTALLIDELPVLAAIAPYTSGMVVRDASELRVKESDRLRQLVLGLRAMGADIDELDEGFVLRGPARLRAAEIDAAHDHRIAMALSVAVLGAEGDTVIRDAECVGVSFPEFFETLERLRGAGA